MQKESFKNYQCKKVKLSSTILQKEGKFNAKGADLKINNAMGKLSRAAMK